MANCCCNSIKVTGPEKDLKKLSKHICAVIDDAKKINIYNYPGMDDLLQALGYTPEQLKDIRRREWFNNDKPKIEDGILSLCTESAWSFQGEAWELVKKKYPKLDIYFQAEELGNDIFCTNDTTGKYFPERYLLDWNKDGNGEMEFFNDNDDFIKYVKDNIDEEINDFESAMKALKDINENGVEDDFAYLHEVEYFTDYALVD